MLFHGTWLMAWLRALEVRVGVELVVATEGL